MTDDATYRRRRVVAVAVAALIVVVIGAVLLWPNGDSADDAIPASTTAAPLPPETAQAVIDRFQSQPCTLIAPEEVQQASERRARVDGGGPPQLCTYDLLGKPADDVITAQVSGPVSATAFKQLTSGAAKIPGGTPAYWLAGGGTGGRLLARRGSVSVEIAVRLADADVLRLQQIGRLLMDHALARIPPNRVSADVSADDSCSLVSTQKISRVLGAEASALPAISPDACSFRAGSSFASVERITGTLPDLHAIARSTTGTDGKVAKWTRTDVALGDEAVYLADPDPQKGNGELYVRKGKAVFHVVVTGAKQPQATARAVVELVLP
ncbi:MAG: hypothetical protein JWM89_1861 [Acidimicrobiales bacterium]|nr:hypothetical protein [Acidimicrobiales bacterium]